MNKDIINYIKENSNLIKSYNFQALYIKCDLDSRPHLTEFFHNAKIDIFPYLFSIPAKFAKDLNIFTSINIPYNIKNIGIKAFEHCFFLENVNIDSGVNLIDMYVFENCISLKSIELGNSLEVIGANAFINCQELNTIKIPKTLKEIKYDIFKNCYSLKDIYYEGTIEEWKKININKRNDQLFTCTIHCIDGNYIYDN